MIVPLLIEDIAFGGDGVGRYQNQAVFVPYTAPGDEAFVRIKDVKKRHAHGIIHEGARLVEFVGLLDHPVQRMILTGPGAFSRLDCL